jgi:hypothetical protein
VLVFEPLGSNTTRLREAQDGSTAPGISALRAVAGCGRPMRPTKTTALSILRQRSARNAGVTIERQTAEVGAVEDRLSHSRRAGVYLLRDKSRKVIYVGKARACGAACAYFPRRG